jgi:hypothetical protein
MARKPLLIAASVYGAYLLAGNVVLNTPVGHDLGNRKPEKFVASWASAWTLFPGQVHARDVRMAGHTRHMVWSVQADYVRARLALLPLLAKELRVPTAVATGVAGGATYIDVVRTPPPPRPGGWTVRFDGIVADHVRHAYFNDLVLQGDGRAEVGFVKTLRGGPMQVLPSSASFEDGTVFRNGSRLAWDAKIGAALAIAQHRREEAPGIRKLEMTDLELEVDATTAGLRAETRPDQKPDIRLTQGPGRLNGKLAWQRGSLAPGGQLRLSLPVEGDLDGTFESAEAGIDLHVTDTEIRVNGGVAPLHAGSISVSTDLIVKGTTVPLQDVASLAQRTSGHFASRWHFDSLAWLAQLMPGSKLVSFDGAGTVLADLKFHDGNLDAGSFLEVPHVAATANALGNRFAGDAQAKITFRPAGEGQLQPHLEAVMQSFRIAPAEAPDQPYVYGQDLHIDATASGDRRTLDDRIHARLWFKDARVPDLRAYNRYLPNSRLKFVGGQGRASADLQFDREGGVGNGTFRIVGTGVHLGLDHLALLGNIEIDTQLQRADLRAHSFKADGSRVTLQGVRVSDGNELLGSDWWGEVGLDTARLDWDKPMALDGRLKARMRDVGVLLALYSQKKELPGWVRKLVDQGEATADGRIRWRGDMLLLEPFAARNERFEVLARLRLRQKQATGDLFANWGALNVGAELADGEKDFHLVGARKWFDSQPSLEAR